MFGKHRFVSHLFQQNRQLCTPASLGNGYLKPVLRKIHPDLFVSEGSDIQQANLKCIQSLREIWHSLDDIIPQVFIKHRSTTQSSFASIVLKSPLQSTYEITCFFKPQPLQPEESEANLEFVENSIIPIKFRIVTPPALTKSQMLTIQVARSSLLLFLKQKELLFKSLSLEIPWNGLIPPSLDQEEENVTSDSLSSAHMQMINSSLFDRAVINHHKNNNFSNSLFDNIPQYRKHGKNLQFKLKKQEQLAQINKFIEQGHIRLKNVAITDEIIVIEKMRQFLNDYGDVINFSGPGWEKVIFLLENKANRLQNTVTTTNNNTATTTASDDKTEQDQTSSAVKGKASVKVKKGRNIADYAMIEKAGYFICIVPVNFKTASLLHYLQDVLPCSKFLHLA